MSMDALLAAAARDEQSLMRSECTVTRDGTPVFNDVTGEYTTPSTTVYEGKCKFLKDNSASRDVGASETQVQIVRYVAGIPLSETSVQPDDIFTLTSSHDAAAVGRPFRIDEVVVSDRAAERVLTLEEVQ